MNLSLTQSQNPAGLFKETFFHAPQWVSTAPGRVNLIGEHTDYNLLPVLPMTIDRTIRIYGRTRDDGMIRLVNASSDFPIEEILLDQPIEPRPGHWTNYVRAAIQTIVTTLRAGNSEVRGFDALIQSDLPPAAGLSSSSALVIASCLALLHANNSRWSMVEVAERMRLAEQYVGTAGGGMDQAAIALGEKGSALLIEFDPLRTTSVTVPGDIAVFIINSGQKAEKTGAARYSYNRRALECALAVEILKRSTCDQFDTTNWESLRDVYVSCSQASMAWSEFLLSHLPVEPISFEKLLGMIERNTLEDICETRKLSLDDIREWLPDNNFYVYPRAAHVLAEADRVYAFHKALAANDTATAFQLARASHASCRDLYHISTPMLENLVTHAQAGGAGAARITGAGFGGCLVAMVPEENVARFRTKMNAVGITAEQLIEAVPEGPARVENHI